MSEQNESGEIQGADETSYDASNPAAINLARKKYSRKKANRLHVIKALMDLPQGRAWMYDLLEFCHIYHTPFVAGQPDSSAFRAGEQNVGQKILSDVVEANPDAYMQMCKESKINRG